MLIHLGVGLHGAHDEHSFNRYLPRAGPGATCSTWR
jgi:hypothetical protein